MQRIICNVQGYVLYVLVDLVFYKPLNITNVISIYVSTHPRLVSLGHTQRDGKRTCTIRLSLQSACWYKCPCSTKILEIMLLNSISPCLSCQLGLGRGEGAICLCHWWSKEGIDFNRTFWIGGGSGVIVQYLTFSLFLVLFSDLFVIHLRFFSIFLKRPSHVKLVSVSSCWQTHIGVCMWTAQHVGKLLARRWRE